MALDLLNANQFPIVFEFTDNIEPFWRLDRLLLLLFLLHVFLCRLFQSHVLKRWHHFILSLAGFHYCHPVLGSLDGLLFSPHQSAKVNVRLVHMLLWLWHI